jgi:hypothetical protein
MLSRRELMVGLAAAPFAGSATAGAQARRIGGAPITVRDRRLWVDVRVAGHGPYPFVIDTGSFANMIRADLARELNLPRLPGRLTVVGISGREALQMVRGSPVLLGNIDIGFSEFGVVGEAAHRASRGMMSSLMLTTVDAELDFDANEWRVHPDGRPPVGGYQPIPSRIARQERGHGAPKITVEVAIGGRTFRLHVDTGAPGQMLLWGGAPEVACLWSDTAPYSPVVLNGFGPDDRPGRLVRAPDVRIGGIAFPRPLVTLLPGGPAREPDIHGLIGLELLQQMNIATDMRARRVLAMRNRRPTPPERYGMSGMWIEARGERLFIAQLSPQSPAAEAGLRVGDEVIDTALRPFIARLSGAPGDRIPISYRRAGQERTTALVLRPFL